MTAPGGPTGGSSATAAQVPDKEVLEISQETTNKTGYVGLAIDGRRDAWIPDNCIRNFRNDGVFD